MGVFATQSDRSIGRVILILASLLCSYSKGAQAYQTKPQAAKTVFPSTRNTFFGRKPALCLSKNDAADDDSTGNGGDWLESLRVRQKELDQKEKDRSNRWREAACSSGVAAVLPDWVRRVAVNFPLAACGSASGSLFVVHLERSGEIIAANSVDDNTSEDDEDNEPENLAQTLRLLYGEFDGGGTVAVAFLGNLICDAGRSGGVNLWRLDGNSGKLIAQGSIPALERVLVTCLHLDEDYLYVATSDGRFQNYPLDDPELPLALQSEPQDEWKVNSPILSMHINSEMGCAVVTTASGSIEIISLEDDESGRPAGSFIPPFDATERKASNAYALSCTMARYSTEGDDEEDAESCSIVCGGNDGSLYIQNVALDEEGHVDFERPFQKPLKPLSPRHTAPVKCLASPTSGLLISGGQDSTMRIWDIDKHKLLYQFVGYKVWLGSLWTDGERIVSDGADNTLVMHDFTGKEEPAAPEKSD